MPRSLRSGQATNTPISRFQSPPSCPWRRSFFRRLRPPEPPGPGDRLPGDQEAEPQEGRQAERLGGGYHRRRREQGGEEGDRAEHGPAAGHAVDRCHRILTTRWAMMLGNIT